MPSIEDVFAATRQRVSSIAPHAAAALYEQGALMVDTRSAAQREQFGMIPGAVLIERNVLEWRLDPACSHRHPAVSAHDQPIVVFCQEGYASVLAVASLGELGLTDVHDLAGGFEAWAAAGLPVLSAPSPR
ncbi:MAG TPA: rhodanese-like domain-containing protein [Acidimicrobiales bacterium]|jgi:rhodanese-related sulfurtransferase|nr:rhodanese-like domain-containing protein [Acidimicrobiales bacterium]